ncbi:putative phage tail assembly chaperone [Salmonella enterica subsp. enterica serovar Montevideo]
MNDKNTQTTAENAITLQVGEHELTFIPTVKDYNDLQNDFMPDNKIAPLKNYLRRHWLPGEDDSPQSLAGAAWLDNHYWENMSIAVNNGIIRAFKGS